MSNLEIWRRRIYGACRVLRGKATALEWDDAEAEEFAREVIIPPLSIVSPIQNQS